MTQRFVAGEIRDATAKDHEAILRLNQSETPHVSSLTLPRLRELIGESVACRVAERDGQLAGFMVAFIEGANYESPNYRWFQARYPKFVYVDRIAVARESRGAGLGRLFYDDLERRFPGLPLCCEVNLRPPNPESMAFHARIGFAEVGQQDTDGGSKKVSLLLKQ